MGYNGFAFILEKPDSATTKLAKKIRHGAHDKKKEYVVGPRTKLLMTIGRVKCGSRIRKFGASFTLFEVFFY